MEREKKNSSLWQILALVLLLCAAFLVIATGTAFGRYKTTDGENIEFEVREPLTVLVGTIETDGETKKFVPGDENSGPVWKTVDGIKTLEFAVSNGTQADPDNITGGFAAADYSDTDQRIKIRIVSGLEMTVDDGSAETPPEAAEIILTVNETEYTAVAESITENTFIYHENGNGWIFTFRDNSGEEICFDLPGGGFSCIEMKIEVTGMESGAEAMLELQVLTEKAD